MKKPILLLLLFSMIALSVPQTLKAGEATDDTVVLSDLTWDEDMEAYYFVVSLSGSRIYTAYNMDIFLPQGINVAYTEDGGEKNYWVYLSEDENFYPSTKAGKKVTFKHDVSGVLLPGNQLRVSCVSLENAEFKANEGELFYVYVTLDAATQASCHRVWHCLDPERGCQAV